MHHAGLSQRNDPYIWFCDESDFITDPRPRRRWMLKGTTPTSLNTGLHIRPSVFGSANPKKD
ncbi:MAG: hypothetical protein P9L92_20120 [Candidatus Electryonea clarkiae]|nr:hypothetical protein [Candidatus Electryonea clarkiae]